MVMIINLRFQEVLENVGGVGGEEGDVCAGKGKGV